MITLYAFYDKIENDAIFRNSLSLNFNRGVTMLSNLKNWYVRRKAINELSVLPDYLLRDLGIEGRHQIAQVVDGKLAIQRATAVKVSAVKTERPAMETGDALPTAA